MRRRRLGLVKAGVFLICLLPLSILAWDAVAGNLGANPIEAVTRRLGDWAIRFLIIALAVTPVRRLTGWGEVARYRRMLGLFAFFYAILHVLSYVGLDHFFAWGDIWADIVKRRYITVGLLAVLLLLPLAVTSTAGMVRRLGGRRWRLLHRLVYPAGVLAVLHFYMLVKADWREPLLYGAIVGALLGYRAVNALYTRPRPVRA